MAIMNTSEMYPDKDLVEDGTAVASMSDYPHMSYYKKVLFALGKIHRERLNK